MSRLLYHTIFAVLALIFPTAALAANLSGTQTLTAGQIFSFDTGTVVASGGDILWTGSGITLQGSATAASGASLGFTGMSGFSALANPLFFALFASFFNPSPIPLSSLAVNTVFGIETNGGNYAAFIVTVQSGTSITFQFITFVAFSGPVITQVLNNYSLIPAGFPNSGISPGSLFIIKGSGLASATSVSALQSSAAPGLATTLNGATVNVTVNGTTTHPAFYYAENVQLALVLPSNTPTGSGTITVTYNGQTSQPFNVQVVASAFGFAAYYGNGSGLGLATNSSTYALYNYTNSVVPGTTIVLYGSGLGADPTRDSVYTPVAFSINGLSHVYVGGIDASIFYQGASGYPGLNEIDVTIPANAPTGCFIPVVGVSTAGVPTNFITLPIGSGICEDPGLGINGTQLTSTVGGQTTFSSGGVEISYGRSPVPVGPGPPQYQLQALASAFFESFTASNEGSFSGEVSIGGCIVTAAILQTTTTITTTGLDAGTITVTGPDGSATLTSSSAGFYETSSSSAPGVSTLPAGFVPATGGTFTFQGTGGANVGPFTAQVVLPAPLLQWTNQAASATVVRSAGLTITWTGGAPGTYVTINGSSSPTSASPASLASGLFTCLAPVAAGQFTVPPYVLTALPASTSGSLSIGNATVGTTFAATGLDYGSAGGSVSYGINATYQ